MPGHNDKEIKKHIESSAELLKKMNGLEQQLSKDLLNGFEAVMGIPIPNAIEADVLKVDSAMKYSQSLTVDEFVSGALDLATAAFSGNDTEVATKAVKIATDAIKQIFGGGSVQVGFQGSSAKIRRNGSVHVAACYASTSLCSHEQWFTATDFYVAKYVFVVFEVVNAREKKLLSLAEM